MPPEDKEAAITAATATYYMAPWSGLGREQRRYIGLCACCLLPRHGIMGRTFGTGADAKI